MTIDFNFAKRPFTNERLPRLVFGLAVTLVVALTAVHGFFLTRYLLREREELGIQVAELREQLRETDAAIDRAESELRQEQTALRNERTLFLTRLFRRKSFSWTALFNELETITPGSVRVTSIAPFEEGNEVAVTLTIVGRTLQDVLEMVRQLEASSFFATVFPVGESNLDELSRGETGVAATLRLRYVKASTETDEASTADGEPAPEGPSPEGPERRNGP